MKIRTALARRGALRGDAWDRDEMVSAVFNVFQRKTVQCAQFHHHKFDPIRTHFHDIHASILHRLGIDHGRLAVRNNGSGGG